MSEDENVFIFGEPEEGTPTLGVVYHVIRKKEISEATGLEPMGYVISPPDDECEQPEDSL